LDCFLNESGLCSSFLFWPLRTGHSSTLLQILLSPWKEGALYTTLSPSCVFAFMKRRGDMKWQSIWFLGAILLQGCGVAFIYQYKSLGFGAFLEYSSIKWALLEHIPLSQLALFAFGIAFVYYLFLYIRTRGVIERSFCWALISIFYALALSTIGPVSSIYFSTAGLTSSSYTR